jgi:flagellar motor switch protein FliN/FliY
MQLDALAESGNISMGSAATALSLLLGHKVEITTPRLSYTTVAEIKELYPIPCVLVRVRYSKGLSGSNVFILSERDAGVIANMMMGDPNKVLPDTLDELYLSAVSEAMNQMMGSSATALSQMFGRTIEITPPDVEYVNLSSADSEVQGLTNDTEVILVSFDLAVGDYISSTMLQLLPFDFAEKMVAELLGSLDGDNVDENEPVISFAEPEVEPVIPEPEMLDVLTEVPQPVWEAEPSFKAEGTVPLELLRDIPVSVTGLLGRRIISLKELMNIAAGSVVELDCPADEPIEILANGKLVGRGEVVLNNDRFGIKITEMIQPW